MHAILAALLLAAELGTVHFPTGARNPEAQQEFERGVAALHNFWYEEAAAAFRRARSMETSFDMAYWGEAMTYNHPIWMEQDREAARRVLASLPRDASNERELDWLHPLEVLYGEGDKRTRDEAYEKAMGALAAKYPDDIEAQTFHALAILGTLRRDADDQRKQMRAAAILEPLLERAPNHPGVLHYMIHAYDDPLHAPLGLRAARRYAQVAPAAHHALHMPSHIFLQLGMWDEAAKSNEQSYAASVAWVNRDKLPGSKRDLHSLTWLHYIYLQQGRFDDAQKLLAEVSGEHATSDRERTAQARMLATWAVESGSIVDTDLVKGGEEDADHCAAAGYATSSDTAQYANALAAIRRGDEAGTKSAIAALSAMRSEKSSRVEKQTLEVMELTLSAMAEQKRGNLPRALELARRAVDVEQNLGAPSGPPDVLKPAHELYGELLAAAGRCEESREQFRRSLLRTPNRRLSVVTPSCGAAGSQPAVTSPH